MTEGTDAVPEPHPADTGTTVRDLVSKMTLEEKVGQMTQVQIDLLSKGPEGRGEPHEIDPAKLEEAILGHHVGSVLSIVAHGFTLDHWREIITAIQDAAVAKSRLHVPVLYGIDAIHGATYTLGSTLFPQPLNMAASFNPALLRREGEVTACEMRASGIPWNFSPSLDLGRQPVWPRLWETFGEDVYLTTCMGRAYIEGHQGSDFAASARGATCLKHYAGYSFPISGHDRTPAWISERMMREYFLPPFEEAVRAGSPAVMVNSAEINGIPGHVNRFLLTDILRGEMQFEGFVISDWRDIQRLHFRDRVAATPKEAVAMAVMAGIDMSMVALDYSFYDLLLECVRDGAVPLSRIDEAVERILRVKLQMGLFADPYPDPSLKERFACPEFTAENLRIAGETIVLAKNDGGLLPLAPSARILVTGPTADLLSVLNGGWTITWQGDAEALYPKDKLTVLGALRARLGSDRISYLPGSTFDTLLDLAAAVDAARNVDAVVLCLGEKAYCETPGNIDDLTLDQAQLELARALAATGKPVVLVMLEGRPRLINAIADSMQAVVVALRPGMEGGRALAGILAGDTVPSAKLPVTYPRFPNALICYDHKPLETADGNNYNPQWPFGHGLSYTTFTCDGLRLDRTTIQRNESLHVSVDVRNTGRRAGAEVVLLYLNDNYGSVSRPVKQLRGFEKITLEPGEQKTVDFTLDADALSFIGRENTRIVEPGAFTVMVGPHAAGFTLE